VRHGRQRAKLQEFLGKANQRHRRRHSVPLVVIGDQLGFTSDGSGGRGHSGGTRQRTGTVERYIREWLGNQAAGAMSATTRLPAIYSSAEQAHALADETSPVFLPGAFQLIARRSRPCRASPRTSAPGRVDCVNTTKDFSKAPSDSFDPITLATWSGPDSRARRVEAKLARERRRPTSAVGTGPRPY